jgi:uncharacterized phage protein (TIGR02218 family)
VKTLPGALATHVALGTTTLGYLLRITRAAPDNQVFAFTSADADVTISGVLHKSAPGLDVSSIALSAGAAVDNLELTTLDDASVFTRADVLGGLWRNAAFTLQRYNFSSPSDGVETIMAGVLGEVRYMRNSLAVELRGLQQFLQQPIGSVSSKTCRARLGDSLCTKALGPFTFAATVTSVTSNQVFTATALTQAADYFGEGILTWTSGPNINLVHKVKTHGTGGVLTLSLPMFQTVAIGHTFSIVAGCRKRMAEDCITKFSNVLNFQGEPHLPGIDAVSKPPK